MAIHAITSDPKPSTRNNGWYYCYWNKPTTRGGECTVLVAPAVVDVIRRGFTFDDSCVAYDAALQADVLNVDFAEPPSVEEPSLPPDPEAGWQDPDPVPASPPQIQSAPAPAVATSNGHRPGVRPSAVRKREAEQLASMGKRLPPGLMKTGMEVAQLFLMQHAMLGSINEPTRTQIAQKLAAIAAIPYYRQQGIQLSEDDVQGMTAY